MSDQPSVGDEAEQYLRTLIAGRDITTMIRKAGQDFTVELALAFGVIQGLGGDPDTARAPIAEMLRRMADAIESGELPQLTSEN